MWDSNCNDAFEIMKKAISNAVALHHKDYTKPIHLEVDASTLGLGGILFQKIDGKIRPIQFIATKVADIRTRSICCISLYYT